MQLKQKRSFIGLVLMVLVVLGHARPICSAHQLSEASTAKAYGLLQELCTQGLAQVACFVR